MAKTPESLVRDYRYKPKIESSARDINTYVKPQERYVAPPQGTTALESLSRALRENSPILMKMFREKQDKRNEELLAQGERIQKESDIKDWDEYVKKHPEHEKYNPFLREGFEKQAAMAKGADYQLWLQDKLTNDETLASMTDQTQINEYIDKQTSDYIKNNKGTLSDRAIASYFIPSANNSRQALMSQFADKKLDELVKAKYDSYEENITKNATAFIAGNMDAINASDESATALAGQLAAQISAHAGNTIIEVSNPKKVNDSTMNAVLTWYNSLAPEYSEFGKKVIENLTGKDNQKLIGITRYKMAFDKVTKEKWNDTVQKDRDMVWYKEQKDKQTAFDVVGKYGLQILLNPTANHSQLFAQVFQEYGEEGSLAAEALRGFAASSQSYSSTNYYLNKALSGGSGGGGGGGNAARDVDAFNFYMSFTSGKKPTMAELQTAVAKGLLTPLQAVKLAQGNGASQDTYKIAEEAMDTCYVSFGITPENLKSREGLAARYSLNAKFRSEVERYNLDFQEKNGRQPTREEAQEHFIKFAETVSKQQERKDAVNKAKTDLKPIINTPTRTWLGGQSAIKLSPIQMEVLLTDYKKNPANSGLVKLKANAGMAYNRMSMSQFIHTLAKSNNISLNMSEPTSSTEASNPAPAPAPSSTAPNKDKTKRGHKM